MIAEVMACLWFYKSEARMFWGKVLAKNKNGNSQIQPHGYLPKLPKQINSEMVLNWAEVTENKLRKIHEKYKS